MSKIKNQRLICKTTDLEKYALTKLNTLFKDFDSLQENSPKHEYIEYYTKCSSSAGRPKINTL